MPLPRDGSVRRPPGRRGALVLFVVSVAVLATVFGGPALGGIDRDGSGASEERVQQSGAALELTTPVLSARRMPELLRSGAVEAEVRAALDPVLAEAPPDACIVVAVDGRVVLDRSGDRPMVPASATKLLTGVAVLDVFGPDHQLVTSVRTSAPVLDGVVERDLYLVGGGDPLLTTPGYQQTLENPEQPVNQFSVLADRIVAAGVREVRGGILGDDSRYDQVRWIPTWPQRYQREGFVGPLSALIVNDGSTGLTQDPDRPASVRHNGDPPLLAAETLVTLLRMRGVQVTGPAGVGTAPPGAREVARLESLPMRDLVTGIVAESDNTTSELLVKELGLERSGQGTTTAGLDAIDASLAARGLPTESLALLDGSGLDPANKLTCRLLVAALDQEGPDSVLAAGLPIAGETGTLRRRMQGTPAEGRVRAKTGTLREVNSLAGFATSTGGTGFTFAYIVNGPEQPFGYQPLDDLMVALVGVQGGPAVADLEPLTPRP